MDLKKHDGIEILNALVVGEADNEPLLGKVAVAQVIKNRMADERWPDAWKEVMLQPWQFSCFLPAFLRPEIFEHRWHSLAWRECRFAAFGVYNGYLRDVTKGANHYYNPKLVQKTPKWARGEDPVVEIGQHLFFKL